MSDMLGALILSQASMAGNVTSPVIDVRDFDSCGLEFIFTGTPSGTFAIQAAADFDPSNPSQTGTWVSLPLSAVPTASGAGDTVYADMLALSMPFIRVVYTVSGGTGLLDIWFAGKSLDS